MLPVSSQHGAIFSTVPLWLGFQCQCRRGITWTDDAEHEGNGPAIQPSFTSVKMLDEIA